MHGIFPKWRILAVIAMLAAWGAGCATTHDSDLPWNTPQSWEGSPAIPGLSGSRGY